MPDDQSVKSLAHGGGRNFVFGGGHEWPVIWRNAKQRCAFSEAPGLGSADALQHATVSGAQLDPRKILCLY
ncbi:MAG: hypothetical protein ABI627_31845 [Polyangiaceae bacterium]